jgi:hypothetical protein
MRPRAKVSGQNRMEETAMVKTRGTGLLMVWTDIDAEFEASSTVGTMRERLPRLLQIPGFLSAGAYLH